jgi:peptidyl-prolyl cis-trans isomerase D
MAIISKIREKSTLLLITIGGALLLFVVSDLFDSNNSFSNRGKMMIGEIDGKEVDGREYEAKVATTIDNYKNNTQQKTLDDQTQEMIRNQVWNQIISEKVLGKEMDELGLTVSAEELYDMVQGSNIHPSVKQAFTDPNTGQFNQQGVLNFLKKMDEDETGATKDRWLLFEDEIKADKRTKKYNALVGKGIFVNSKQAKDDYLAKNKKFDALVVGKKYFSIPDSTVAVTDEELQKYYEENKYKFKQTEESRKIEYVVFNIQASDEDREKTLAEVLKIKEEFKTTDNDTSLINFHSDVKYKENLLLPGSSLPGFDTLLKAGVGTVAGPILDNEGYKLAKVIAIKGVADSVKARHILLKTDKKPAAAVLAEADSLKKLLKAGAKFEELASKLSQDPGSAIKGGDLGWFKPGMMVKPFNDACFNGKVGDMPIVQSQFGVHLIEITARGKETRKYDIGTIVRRVEPGNKTYQATFAKADDFEAKATNAEAFDKTAEEQKVNKREFDIKENQTNIPGIENAREIVGWAYNAEKGSVSKVFELGKRFVIAKLKEITPKGFKPFDQVKEEVTANLRKIKKGEKLTKEIETALASSKDISAIASKLATQVDTAKALTFSSFQLPMLGREMELIGTITSAKGKGFTKPVAGSNGAFVAYISNIEEAPAVQDYKASVTQLKQGFNQRSQYEVFEALKEKAGVVDNRTKSLFQK